MKKSPVSTFREMPIDIAKGLGIILVVAGHTIAAWDSGHESLHKFIYSFHMPVFLGISGLYVANAQPFRNFLVQKIERLIVPFLFWTLLYFSFELAKGSFRSFVGDTKSFSLFSTDAVSALVRVPLLANWDALSAANVFVDLWFLPTLFSLVILLRLLSPLTKQLHPAVMLCITVAFSYAVYYLSSSLGIRPLNFWGIDIAIFALPFVYLFQLRQIIYPRSTLLLPIMFGLVWYFALTTDVAVATLSVSNYLNFIISACAGVILILSLSKTLEQTQLGSIISRIGQRSYCIYVMSGLISYLAGMITKNVAPSAPDISNFLKCIMIIGSAYALYPILQSHRFSQRFALGEAKNSGRT